MLVVILLLVAVGLIILGHVLYAKAKVGDTVTPFHYWGYGISAILITVISIVHFCTVGGAIGLESQYYTYYTYSRDVRDNVLIIDIASLEGKLVSDSENKQSGFISVNRLQSDVWDYNQKLYSIRHWGNDPFVGIIIEKPNIELKPIILR